VDQYRPAMIHLSIDASGSMGSKKWEKVMTVATALAYVSGKIKNIETVITIRGDSRIPIVSVIFDSRKDSFRKARTLFPLLHVSGSTPEGLCFKATLDLITECSREYDTYFINFSDGEPGTTVSAYGQYRSYSGQSAVEHTRRQVKAIQEANVKVLSYFISDSAIGTFYNHRSKDTFYNMYRETASFVDVTNATDVVRTLNTLLLKR